MCASRLPVRYPWRPQGPLRYPCAKDSETCRGELRSVRIGISILTREGQNIWNNGIDQNVYHIASLMETIPFVERVILLNCGDQKHHPANSQALASRFPLVALAEASDAVDVAIEVSSSVDVEWAARLRARGGHVVSYLCGQPYSSIVEPTTFGRPGFFGEAQRGDEIWVLAKDAPFKAFLRQVHRCPVYEVPFLWSPVFLEDVASAIQQDGLTFGYVPGSLRDHGAHPAIFEPNISPVKMGLIPFLICEDAYRVAPATVSKLSFMNTRQLSEHPSFVTLIGSSKLYQDGKALLDGRDFMAKVMALGANMVVSHQITCPQNYLYLDALHGNYPLIHNSPLFSDVGYYYPDSEIGAGVACLQQAVAEHDRELADYSARAARRIASVSPFDRSNRDAYARRLVALSNKTNRKGAA